ncbi:hypothetical protein GCM10010399_37320 [Dactylosporangium fulvum]|uniref:Uncharacterized protein n=1 Tax=Dactylosporangium fulvum TaxID=53359 RepID=A0ABY5VVX6_9ACTN|nr:hypothetical protein [Dactylosporangium fulvum]UWP80954.1 hypothetical protein Dfulv_38400 [Dactylosporangium fulvum]
MDAEAALLLLWAAADIPAPENTDDVDTTDPLTDVGGYLSCGCHGSQPEHTCGPLD